MRAHGFARTALDAVARAARSRLPAVLLLGELGVLRLDFQVQQVHNLGDGNLLRAILYAVAAIRARHRRHSGQHITRRVKRRLFFGRKRATVLTPFRYVLFHLAKRRHARKHRHDIGLVEAEAVRPRHLAEVGASGQKRRGHGFGQIGQTTASCRFHHHNRLVVLARDLHVAARLDNRTFPIQIVHLQLDEVHLRMRLQQFLKRIGAIVHAEAHVANFASRLHLLRPFPQTEVVELLRTLAAYVVQQVVVHIVGAQTLKRRVQARLRCFGVGKRPGQALRGNGEVFARIALHQRLVQRNLRLAVVVHECGIEIRTTRLHKRVHHLFDLLNVNSGDVFGVGQRQAHAAKAQLRHRSVFFYHEMLLSLHFMIAIGVSFKSRRKKSKAAEHHTRPLSTFTCYSSGSRAPASTCMRVSTSSMMRLQSFSSLLASIPRTSLTALYFRSCSRLAQKSMASVRS